MEKNEKGKIQIARENIQQSIENLEREIQRLKIALEEIEETESIKSSQSIEVGDFVKSRQKPFYKGIVTGFSTTKHWVYINQKDGTYQKKALNSVYKVEEL